MADIESVANEFVQFYYNTFDSDRSSLRNLYRDDSYLTFETNRVAGVNSIIETLAGLRFQKVQHKISTFDAQPTPDGHIVVLVTGFLLIDDAEHPQTFAQTFHLVPSGGTYYVMNDLFRLIYA